MASLRDIRKRIRSVKNTRQITKAMKMVAAAKLRKAQDAVTSARPYAQTIEKTVSQLMAGLESGSSVHPLLATRAGKKAEILVITSDRGLAGGFNANITRRVMKFVSEEGSKFESIAISSIGRKGHDFLRNRGLSIRKDYQGIFAKVTYAHANTVAEELGKRFIAGDVDVVYVVYNEFLSAISQQVVMSQLLPFVAPAATTGGAAASVEYSYEPTAQEVLRKLIPQALSVKVFRAILESVASEHGARMSAMENATKNAGEMISKLTLFYNRTRQAVITKELMEIVSGAEALK